MADATCRSVLPSGELFVKIGVGGFVSNDENSWSDWLFRSYSENTSLPKYPIETAEAGELTPDLYERKMRANLENLAKALR